MLKLAPSILSADFACLLEDIQKIAQGGADYIHVDVMDGHFVPNISFGAPVMKALNDRTKLPYDVHLMIENPDQYLDSFVTPQTAFITVHREACVHLHRTIQNIHAKGIKAGVAINPATPVSSLECILEDVDLVLVMSVNPGFGGQKFIPSALEKVKTLAEIKRAKGLSFAIEIDGGITLDNAKTVMDAGVEIAVAGSAVFGAQDVPQRVADFKSIR